MAPPRKTVAQYEAEAQQQGVCLIHSSIGAARKVYQLRHGSLKPDELVCHRCDNPKCIADAHHFVGSHKDNTQDAVAKGRHSGFRKGGARFSGSHTDDARLKIGAASKAMWASRTPEQRAAINKKAWETRHGKR